MEQFESVISSVAAEARRIEEDSGYSAKGHFEAARMWNMVHYSLGLPTIVVAASAGVSASQRWTAWAVGLSIVVAVLSSIVTFLKPNERSANSHKAGTKYMGLRNDTRVFREVTCLAGSSTVRELEVQLHALNARRTELNSSSPQIPRCAYVLAKKRIEAGEADYRSDY